mmetsp:Transcript_2702/g.3551  ORF Transcript_2702/g.3551 Transcript_2702/m.3551 type:complete len:103 (+) Transcript_2702:737-1045(+)
MRLAKSCIPMSAYMKMNNIRSMAKLPISSTVSYMVKRRAFSDFHRFAILNTRKRRNARNMEKPEGGAAGLSVLIPISIMEMITVNPSKQENGLLQYFRSPEA